MFFLFRSFNSNITIDCFYFLKQGELDKSVRLQHELETKVSVLEQKIEELKDRLERKVQEVASQNVKIEELLRQDADKDEVIEKSKKEIHKLVEELRKVDQVSCC